MSNLKVRSKKKKKEEEKPKFEPGKSYKWEPEDEFILDGKEFSFLYNMFKEKAQEAEKTMAVFNLFHTIFEEGIKEGVIVEQTEEDIKEKSQPVEEINPKIEEGIEEELLKEAEKLNKK